LQIYNWVRNNIEFVPTWGSIQGAQMTMETGQGNAMDTASLLISLLRASNIHARYVMGTVQLPIEQIMNWVGNFTDANAALDFMSSGGVPTTALTDAGKVVKARFEHVWVEAWIDYLPSRGAKHKEGEGDTWIPLDASFKQYAYTDGIDIGAAVPFDGQTFIDQLTASATINEAEGYATGVDSLLVQQTMTDYQSRVEAYISQQYPDATVGDVLGKKDVVAQDYPYLLGTLPYRTEVRGGSYAVLPANLRYQMSFKVATGEGLDSNINVTRSLPELAGKKITLSYAPATSADDQLLLFLVGSGAASLPAYLIKLTPELRIGGELVATGTEVTMGTQQPFDMIMNSPSFGATLVTNQLTCGTYNAIELNLGSVSAAQAYASVERAKLLKAKLGKQDLTGISKDDVLGEFLHAHGLAYWGMLDYANKVAAASNGVAHSRLPSEGIFTYNLGISEMFGMPVFATPTGFATDIDADVHVVLSKDGNKQKAVSFMTQSGLTGSIMEAGVYDLSFNKTYTGRGVSAAHVLEEANLQRIPIYTVTVDNIDTILPRLQISTEIKMDIRSAVGSGKTVTIPEREIAKGTWLGTGYIIYDLKNGAGAYMISGGLAGGSYDCQCFGFDPTAEFILTAILIGAGLSGASPIILTALSLIIIIGSSAGTICELNKMNLTESQKDDLLILTIGAFALGVALAVAAMVFIGPFVIAISILWALYSILISMIILGIGRFVESNNTRNE
jgi:hypothetical protein